ncbi:MAG: hypothetical protein J0H19_15540 [Rhodospirillales bacterium]|nr:hypothetical protein [Rhodospirillales bacterium]
MDLLSVRDHHARAHVSGTNLYRCELTLSGGNIAGRCTCAAHADFGFCKHLVATGLAANTAADAGVAVPDRIETVRAHLLSLGTERLTEMLLTLAGRDPLLFVRLDAAAVVATGDDPTVVARLRTALRRAVEAGGRDGTQAEADARATEIGDVLDQLDLLLDTGRTGVVLGVLDDVFEAMNAAFENVDGMEEPYETLLERAAAQHMAAWRNAEPAPIDLARDLFAREVTDPSGLFEGASATYQGLLGPEGLAQYRQLALDAWAELAPPARTGADAVVATANDRRRRRVLRILDSFAERDGDVDQQIQLRVTALAEARDYLALAQFCLAHGRQADAIRFAEDGAWLFDDATGEPLQRFLAERYLAARRSTDAAASFARAFAQRPSLELFTKMALLREELEAGGRAALTDEIEAELRTKLSGSRSNQGRLAFLLLDILLAEGQLSRAWTVARDYKMRPDVLMDLAGASEDAMPTEALEVYAAAVELRIGSMTRPDYEEASRLIVRMGAIRERHRQAAAHRDYLLDLIHRHGGKRSFVRLLQDAVAAAGPTSLQSSLVRKPTARRGR